MRQAALLFLALAAAVPEPPGFWSGPPNAPTPDSISGGRVIHTAELAGLLAHEPKPVLIDVSPTPKRPPALAPGAMWMPLPHQDIPGSTWLPGAGAPALPAADDAALRQRLASLTGGALTAPVIVYCHPQCWLSWNAARRFISYGYRKVMWDPDGIEGWEKAGHPLVRATRP